MNIVIADDHSLFRSGVRQLLAQQFPSASFTEASCFDEMVSTGLSARRDPRDVVADPHARYFGAILGLRTLLPADGATLSDVRFQDWLAQSGSAAPAAAGYPARRLS